MIEMLGCSSVFKEVAWCSFAQSEYGQWTAGSPLAETFCVFRLRGSDHQQGVVVWLFVGKSVWFILAICTLSIFVGSINKSS